MPLGTGNFFNKLTNINFTVKNNSPNRKIHVFGYPIMPGQTRDLFYIPEISEDDIRSSLVKGELAAFIRNGTVSIVSSSIDLSQYDASQAAFISAASTSSSVNTGYPPSKNIRILAIGDSHINGHLNVATVSGSETIGTYSLNSSKQWSYNGTSFNGATVATPYQAATVLANGTGSVDPNIALVTNTGSFINWIPGLIRSAYPFTVNNVYIANFGMGGASSFTWSGEPAHGYFAGLVAPNDGDTITIAGTTYTFRTSPAVAYDVQISTATGTVLNLSNAINGEGTGFYATGTNPNPNVYCPNPTATTYGALFAINSGVAGNSLQISSSNLVRLTAVNGSLTPTSPVNLYGGNAISALYSNMKATLSGFGTPVDVVISTLGTNDASRPGYRGRGFATNMAQLISNIQNDFPGTKFINWLPPASTSGSTWNTAMTTIVSAMSALAVGNVYAPNLNTLGIGSGNASIISADGIHLSQYGYSLTASLYAGQIGSALGLLY